MAHLDRDYPDRMTKPVDNPYGPYADPFPPEQHRLGPFPPIDAFYARLKSSK
jgi:thiosulfate dehydrogenase